MPVFFFIWDVKERQIIYVTPKFYEQVEDSASEKRNKNFNSLIDPICRNQLQKFFNSLSPKNNYTSKIDLKTRNLKGVNWIEIRSSPVEEANEEVELVAGHIIDITDKKEKLDSLEGVNRNFDAMMQLISHDMRQPFTKISLLVDLIKMEHSANKKINQYVDKIKDASSTAHELLQSFLQITVLNYSEGSLQTQKSDLGHLLQHAVESFDVELTQKNLTLEMKIPEEEIILPVNVSLFEQLIKNIVSNAIKFTPSRGTIIIELSQNHRFNKIKVSDTGIGIPQKILSVLFKDITAVQRTGLEGQKSTGLGLILAKKISEVHHGTINVESEEGKGTTCTIVFPLEPHEDLEKASR